MKFELICKQTKKTFIDKKDNKEKEYTETKFYLYSDELKKEIPINPFEYDFNGNKSSNKEVLKAFAIIIKE